MRSLVNRVVVLLSRLFVTGLVAQQAPPIEALLCTEYKLVSTSASRPCMIRESTGHRCTHSATHRHSGVQLAWLISARSATGHCLHSELTARMFLQFKDIELAKDNLKKDMRRDQVGQMRANVKASAATAAAAQAAAAPAS